MNLNRGIKIPFQFLFLTFFIFGYGILSFAQSPKTDEKAEAVIKKAVENLGGEKYLQSEREKTHPDDLLNLAVRGLCKAP